MCATQDGDVLIDLSPRRSWLAVTGPVALLIIIADRLTKWWIESRLEPGPCLRPDDCIDIIGSLRIHFIENPGMAFSQGENVGQILAVVVIAMTALLIRLAMRTVSPARQALLGLIIGGAIGNLIDRIIRAENGFLSGSVVDFVDLQWFPIWNFADAGVTCGVIGLLLLGGRGEPALSSGDDATDGGTIDTNESDHEQA
ncbi:MAG: signal peptidase II [Acidimicrobiales bacterium]